MSFAARLMNYSTAWLARIISASALGASPATAQMSPIAADQATSLEKVIVTAGKREATVKDTATAITALTDTRIETLGLNAFADYSGYVASLEFNGGGAPGVGTIIIRGINSGYSQVSQTVGFYIDDMPFTESSTGFAAVNPDPDLTDIDRVEVLKGPQSTLFGASALGGLVRIITKPPDLARYTGELRLDGVAVDGGGSGGGLRGLVNIPIVADRLAIRMTAFDRDDPGDVDNVQTHQDNINRAHVYGGRLTLRYAPNSKIYIDFSAFVQNIRDLGISQEDLELNTLQPIEGRYQYASYFNPTLLTDYQGLSLTEHYRFTAGEVSNSTSYSRFRGESSYDLTISYDPLFDTFGASFPNQALVAAFSTPLNKITEQLHYNSRRLGPVELQGGLFFTHEDAAYDAHLVGKDGANGMVLSPPYDNVSTGLQTSTFDEYAAYADATLYLSSRIDGAVGIRQSYNVQRADITYSGLLTPPSNAPSGSKGSDTSYSFTLRWRPIDSLSTYARAASAYRPGGPQYSPSPSVPSSFGPDNDWDYEIGAKGVWASGKVSADADIYYIRWTNIQLDALLGGVTVTGNGGDAHSEGAELQAQFVPIPRLAIGAAVAYDQTRIDSANPSNTAGAVVGDPLPYIPKWSGSLTADYAFPVARFWASVGGGLVFQGARQSSFSGDALNTTVTLPAYQLFNLRLRLDWAHYSVIFHVDNVANAYALANSQTLRLFPGELTPANGVPVQPRTFRLSLEARF
jgi:outer membrane receptor protein involved in Fe transport